MCVCVTQHGGGGEQLAVADLLPDVLQGVGSLGGHASQHHVLAHLGGALSVAPGPGGLLCGHTAGGPGGERGGRRHQVDNTRWSPY